ncbi:hypothetical protein AXF42_Ash016196 [Apostasia shenzhenica]|uniref:Uncharacterized protein n=1 Tax=Apostasia shenzhenica TaxID=1088818 RepID=A0A2I0AEQ5_9ASPA|nr:hypothetical protein AXF42_Ash016196 [Apostasia shenzhenica]
MGGGQDLQVYTAFTCSMATLPSCFVISGSGVAGREDERINNELTCLVLPQPSILATAAATTPPSSSLQRRPWISGGEPDLPPARLFPSSPSLCECDERGMRAVSGETYVMALALRS